MSSGSLYLVFSISGFVLTIEVERSLAPGAASLLDKPGTKFINPKTVVRELKVEEWVALLKAFNEWPFAPKVCALYFLTQDNVFNFLTRNADFGPTRLHESKTRGGIPQG